MAISPKDALLKAQDALELKWTGDQQVGPVTGVVEALVNALGAPDTLLRTVQVLWLPDGAKDRPSAKRVLDLVRRATPSLVQSPGDALSWARVAAWAALRVGVESERKTAAVVSLMRSGAEWTSMDARFGGLVSELVLAAGQAAEAEPQQSATSYASFDRWPTEQVLQQQKSWPEVKGPLDGWGGQPVNLHSATVALHTKTATMIEAERARVDALKAAVQHIETALQTPPSPAALERLATHIGLLWWGQSLYSSRLGVSYRDLPRPTQIFWMADEMAEIASLWPADAHVAYYTETLRRVAPDLDEQASLREHAVRLVEGVMDGVRRRADAKFYQVSKNVKPSIVSESTALPITLLVEGARQQTAAKVLLTQFEDAMGVDLDRSISLGTWARWVYRERFLNKFFWFAW
jgi:GTPase-associated system helical domain